MTVRVGVIGTGVMGADHARLLARVVSGAELAAVFDADPRRAETVAAEHGVPSAVGDPVDLVRDPAIDAVLIAAPDETHKPLVLACLAAGKPVLCEKPLATSAVEALEVVGEEVAIGRRMVQVGFMRRFDPGYVAMRQAVRGGELGAPLIFHCLHRNAVAPSYTTAETIMTNTAVHEIDIARFVLDDEVVRVTVVAPRRSGHAAIPDPLLLLLHMESGAVVDAEVFVNARYGYDVRGELVCEAGTVSLMPPAEIGLRRGGSEGILHPGDWRPRFAAAYRAELQAWIDAVAAGTTAGASAWDGYVATAVAETALEALRAMRPLEVKLAVQPSLYAGKH